MRSAREEIVGGASAEHHVRGGIRTIPRRERERVRLAPRFEPVLVLDAGAIRLSVVVEVAHDADGGAAGA